MSVNDMVARQNNVAHLLQEKLAEEVGPIRESTKALEALSGETRQMLERMQAALEEESQKRAELEGQLKGLQIILNRPGVGGFDDHNEKEQARARKRAFNKACAFGWGRLDADERKMVQLDQDHGIHSGAELGHGQDSEFKTLFAADATTGGFLTVPEYVDQLIQSIILVSDMHSLVDVRMTAKPYVMIPRRDQTTSASRIAEQATRTETQNPKFGMVQVFPYESFAMTLISRTDLDDSELDLGGFIMSDFATQFAKLEGNEIINGKGPASNQCLGFLNDPSINGSGKYTTTANAGAYDYASLVKVKQSLKTGYRTGATWILTTETLGELQALTDNQGRPLWAPMAMDTPEKLLGYPYREMPDMPQDANNGGSSGAFSIAFGNFKVAYQLVVRKQVSIQVLQERYADQNAIGYMGYYRFGGTTKLPEAIKLLKVHP